MSLTLNEPPAPSARLVRDAGPTAPSLTTVTPRPTTVTPRPTTAGPRRDPAIDLVRFLCLIVVVVLHSMMSAAVLGPEGTVQPTVALSGTTGFAVASWFFQVMPLFFVIGGCAGIIGWRRTRARGGTWADYLRARLRRLIVPVTVLITLAGIGLSVASELGVPSDLIAEASRRIGQPLWFLAVYVGLTSLVPLAVHFHERAPRRSFALLAGAVIIVDGLVAVTGVHGLGYLGFVLVWPLVQQLGFVYADALERPVARARTWAVLVSALLAVVGLVWAGVYSPNMLVNLNPPTGALVLLGVVQMCALRLVHARLNRMLTVAQDGAGDVAGKRIADGAPVGAGQVVRAGATDDTADGADIDHLAEAALESRFVRAQIWRRVIDWGNRYGMQVYLWHMGVVIVLIGGLGTLAGAVSGLPGAAAFVLPDIGSGWWWASRLPWLFLVMGLSALVAVLTARIPLPSERRLAAVGRTIGGLVREMRGTSDGAHVDDGNGDTRADNRVGDTSVGDETSLSPQIRAVIAVGAATAGIAIALLIGIAPLIWTLTALALLMGSLVMAAGLETRAADLDDQGARLDAPGARITPPRRPAGR